MSIKNIAELKRLHAAFEKEADKFRNLKLSIIYIMKGWTSEPKKSECFNRHVVPLWQYYGRITTQEEQNQQTEIVRNSNALNPIPGAQLYCYAGFEGDDLDFFMTMAKRAGNLFSDEEITNFNTQRKQEILNKLPGLRPVEIDGVKLFSGLFGQQMIVTNSNPAAVWINFIHYNGAKTNPLKGRNHDIELDPFVESLLAIERLLNEAGLDKQNFKSSNLAGKEFKIALSFAGENRAYVSQVASIVEKAIGENYVFYDSNYKAQLAKPNLDTILQEIYISADLVVVFLSQHYSKKEWCGLEWRAIREIIKQKQDDKVMLMRFDNEIIPGLFSIDGYIDLTNLSPTVAANLILERFHLQTTN